MKHVIWRITWSEDGDSGRDWRNQPTSHKSTTAAALSCYAHILSDSSKSIPVQKFHYIHCKTMTSEPPCCYNDARKEVLQHTDLAQLHPRDVPQQDRISALRPQKRLCSNEARRLGLIAHKTALSLFSILYLRNLTAKQTWSNCTLLHTKLQSPLSTWSKREKASGQSQCCETGNQTKSSFPLWNEKKQSHRTKCFFLEGRKSLPAAAVGSPPCSDWDELIACKPNNLLRQGTNQQS